jgi:hypothetical protein
VQHLTPGNLQGHGQDPSPVGIEDQLIGGIIGNCRGNFVTATSEAKTREIGKVHPVFIA